MTQSHADKKTIFNVLGNDIRRRIFLNISDQPRTYTWLLEDLEIESGHLAYHLRNMGGLIEKDTEGVYNMSKLGVEASKILEEEKDESTKVPESSPSVSIIGIILVMILVSSVLYFIQPNDNGFGEAEYREESKEHLNNTLTIIYEIFEKQSVDRDSFTELVMETVELHDRLSKLSEVGSPEFNEYAEAVAVYGEEFTEILKNSDDKFLVITVEKRQLIRDLHSLLVELESILIEE